MIKFFLLVSVLINVVFVSIFFVANKSSTGGKVLIVTNEQLNCLSSWRKKQFDREPLFGPDMFKGHYVIRVDDIPENTSFEFEFSGCFYSAFSENVSGVESLQNYLNLYKEQGFDKVGFYKSADSSSIYLFAKK